MGYSTDFEGRFSLNRKLDEETHDFLMRFSQTRRMARNVDPKYGIEGEFYAESTNNYGQDKEDNIIDYNFPPRTQPNLWCNWQPSEDGMFIEWTENEKSGYMGEWIQYIITNFLAPKDYVLNGISNAQGEEDDDVWHIVITDNKVEILDGHAELPQENTMFMGVDWAAGHDEADAKEKVPVRKMSIGIDSTLENWINMTSLFFGEDSPATKFLQEKVAKSPNGLQEEVVADERQLIMTLHMMNIKGSQE